MSRRCGICGKTGHYRNTCPEARPPSPIVSPIAENLNTSKNIQENPSLPDAALTDSSLQSTDKIEATEVSPMDFSEEELLNAAANISLNLPTPDNSADSEYNPDEDIEEICTSDSQQENPKQKQTVKTKLKLAPDVLQQVNPVRRIRLLTRPHLSI